MNFTESVWIFFLYEYVTIIKILRDLKVSKKGGWVAPSWVFCIYLNLNLRLAAGLIYCLNSNEYLISLPFHFFSFFFFFLLTSIWRLSELLPDSFRGFLLENSSEVWELTNQGRTLHTIGSTCTASNDFCKRKCTFLS